MSILGNGSAGVSVVCNLGTFTGGVGGGTILVVLFRLGVLGVLDTTIGLCSFLEALLQQWDPGNIVERRPKTSWRALISQSCASHI